MLKRIFSLIIAGATALSICACAQNSGAVYKFNDEDFKDFLYYYVEDEVLHLTSEQIDGKTSIINCQQLRDKDGFKQESYATRDYDLVKDDYKSIRFDNYVLLNNPVSMFSQERANIENIEKLVIKGSAGGLFSSFRGTAVFSEMNTSYITHMGALFRNCSFTSLNLNKWDVSNVESMNDMFADCEKLNELKIDKWNVQNVNSMFGMFSNCSLKSLDLSKWKLNDKCNIGFMFERCYSLRNLKIGKWENILLHDRASVFDYCHKSIVPEWYKAKDKKWDAYCYDD